MGNVCASNEAVARSALEHLALGAEELSKGNEASAIKHFLKGLRCLPCHEYVTQDVTTSAEAAIEGIEEGAIAVSERSKQADAESKQRREQTRASIKRASNFGPPRLSGGSDEDVAATSTYKKIVSAITSRKVGTTDAEDYRKVVSHMRRATRLYGNMEMGMELYDVQRAIGGDTTLDAEDDAKRYAVALAANPLSAACRAEYNNNTSKTRNSMGEASFIRARRRRTAMIAVEAQGSPKETLLIEGTCPREQLVFSKSESRSPESRRISVSNHIDDMESSALGASGVEQTLSQGGERFAPILPSIIMTQPSASAVARVEQTEGFVSGPATSGVTHDAIIANKNSMPAAALALKSAIRTQMGTPEPESRKRVVIEDSAPQEGITDASHVGQRMVRAVDDHTAMSVHVDSGLKQHGPILAPWSSVALFNVQDAQTIECILRVLQYRLLVGDHFLVHEMYDRADEQYLMVSGASMFMRMKETYVYIQAQTQRLHARACLGISAVALGRARQLSARFPTTNCVVEATRKAINRNLAIALQHSISVRKAESSSEETLADVLRSPYNTLREEHTSLRGRHGNVGGDKEHLMDAAALAREELTEKVRRHSEKVNSLMSNGALDELKVRNYLDAQMGTALKGIVGTYSSVVCDDGSYLWASVLLVDALRLEAESRLEMILGNNLPRERTMDAEAVDTEDELVGTLEDCQTVISGFQKAVGLCVSQYSTVSPEYRKLKARLNTARSLLRWNPETVAKAAENTNQHTSSVLRRISTNRRKSVAIADVLTSVVTRHNNFMACKSSSPQDLAIEPLPLTTEGYTYDLTSCVTSAMDGSRSLYTSRNVSPSPKAAWLSRSLASE